LTIPEIYFCWIVIIEELMLSQLVIPLKVGTQSATAFRDFSVSFPIHFFLFHGPPKPLDKDIV